MKEKLKFVKITRENIDFATEFQMSLFEGECGYEHFLYTIDSNNKYLSYYLVYLNNELVGITGIYSFEQLEETNSLWLGWFGLDPKYRGRGLGKQMLLDTLDIVKEYAKNDDRIKYFRLYTSTRNNPIACKLYREVMDIEEKYDYPGDFDYDGSCLIFTKILDPNDQNKKWNNRFLNLNRIVEQEIEGGKVFLDKKF